MNITDIVNAIILGAIEGLTEFLPVSSTGHLILFNRWFHFSNPAFTKMFDIFIQSGAIIAVMVYFRRRILPIYASQTQVDRKNIRSLWLRAFVGFLPAVAVGLVADDFIEAHLMTPVVVSLSLIAWGFFIIIMERRNAAGFKAGKKARYESVLEFPIGLVVAIGLIQCLGMIPGTSRSAATIVGAMLLGATRVAAAEFSFFLAIPTLLGAGGYSFLKQIRSGLELGAADILVLAAGTTVAFVTAWSVIALFMNFIKNRDFRVFGWYRILLGIAVIAFLLVTGV